jgi:hypothetical protein
MKNVSGGRETMFNHLLSLQGAAGTRVAADPVTSGDNLWQLRDLAGQILTAVVVLIVIAGVVGAVLFVIGKMTALSKTQTASLLWTFRIFLGASIIGSVGGLIFWGSGLGKFDLMPEGARPAVVEVTKNPAKSTCTNTVEKHGAAFPNNLSDDDIRRYATELLTDADAKEIIDADKNGPGQIRVTGFRWTPAGPDCTTNNLTPDACKDVRVSGSRAVEKDYKPRTTSDCKN